MDELVSDISFPMVLKNVKVSQKPELESLPKVMNVIAEKDLGKEGRLLVVIREQSLARVVVEGSSLTPSKNGVEKLPKFSVKN